MAASRRRNDILKWLAGAASAVVVEPLLARFVGPIDGNPWLAAAILLPLAAAVWILGRPLYRDRRVLLGGGFLAFFIAFCLLFALAANTDLLSGPRTELSGYEQETPRNWLGLGRFGDWRYRLAPESPPADDLLVITTESVAGWTREETRLKFSFLIKEAVRRQAKGIAFDYFLEQPSQADRFLCRQLDAARQAGVPVLFGYRQSVTGAGETGSGRVTRIPPPVSLRDCLPAEQLGSLVGYLEGDGIIRRVPLYLRGDPELESLGLKVARLLAGETPLELPASRLVQFLPPGNEPSPFVGWPQGDDTELFRDRFVFVGTAGNDVQQTPFAGKPVPGVRIHAWTAHALRSGALVRRAHNGWTLLGLLGALYSLTLVQARGAGRRWLLASAALLSLTFLAAAAAAMFFGRVWIDVSYPWIGLWTMTTMLSGGAALQQGRARPTPERPTPSQQIAAGTAATTTRPHDVFLSHNSKDKPAVRELARALQQRGIKVWLDEWELAPGRPWQEALEEVIETVRSAAVILGPAGLGPWEIPEMRACLSECVDRDLPVIPVLLPGVPDKPELPLFLRSFTWVDLRDGLTDASLDRLEWGITGVKPERGK